MAKIEVYLVDIELVRDAFKNRDAVADLEVIFDVEEERETSPAQDVEDYRAWVDKYVDRARDAYHARIEEAKRCRCGDRCVHG